MKINFYNREPSKIPHDYERYCLHPLIILADRVMYCSISGCLMFVYLDIETWTDEMIFTAFGNTFKDDPEDVKIAEDVKVLYLLVKKIRTIKHKDKGAMLILGNFNSIIRTFKKALIAFQVEQLEDHSLLELVPFVADEVLKLRPLYFIEDTTKEDEFIQEISNTLTERKNILALDFMVDGIFRFTTLDLKEKKASDFIKIPLWEFPPFIGLDYAKIKYTRENLILPLAPFKTMLKELSEQLFGIRFLPENMLKIKQLCNDKLSLLIAPVQKSIDESIYLSQLKNNLPDKFNMKFCLGIASAETIVNYYEKIDVILPYVAAEIKQQISKHIDLKATYVFTYFELNSPEKDNHLL